MQEFSLKRVFETVKKRFRNELLESNARSPMLEGHLSYVFLCKYVVGLIILSIGAVFK